MEEDFFKQDLVSKRITSFAIGKVWIYFYRETAIGYRIVGDDAPISDAAFVGLPEDEVKSLKAALNVPLGYKSESAFISVPQGGFPNDHYTSKHLITNELVKEAWSKGGKPDRFVTIKNLAKILFDKVSEEINNQRM